MVLGGQKEVEHYRVATRGKFLHQRGVATGEEAKKMDF